MGLDINGTKCLFYAKKIGVDFSKCATLGRQGLHLFQADLKKNMVSFGYTCSNSEIDNIFNEENGYIDILLEYLGAKIVHSFDASGYEGATYIHDMNNEIPDKFAGKYSVVLDGGTLEHVFNFPTAIKNSMKILKKGGYYLGITPVNNFMGHGFYQFSPELYYSIFDIKNGFEIKNIIAFQNKRKTNWYSVAKPSVVKSRVCLRNCTPVYLFVIAKKISHSTIFESFPQQSDYIPEWNKDKRALTSLHFFNRIRWNHIESIIIRVFFSGFNPKYFKKIKKIEEYKG